VLAERLAEGLEDLLRRLERHAADEKERAAQIFGNQGLSAQETPMRETWASMR
jgi:hypothetical protein